MVTQTFGDVLFSPGSECLKDFPSPESLKKRIIISTKPPQEYLEAKDAVKSENDPKSGKTQVDEEAWGQEVPDLKGANVVDDKVWRIFCVTCCFADSVCLFLFFVLLQLCF